MRTGAPRPAEGRVGGWTRKAAARPAAGSASGPSPGRTRVSTESATNDPIDTDVLVVGAGPGGSSTAYHLARRGLDVMLVDRAVFPREKVCGDRLNPRGAPALHAL